MAFANGKKTSELKAVGKVGRKRGTGIRFWPDPKYFDTIKFHIPRLKHVLRAKAVLCPDLLITFKNEADKKDNEEWQYREGLLDYLLVELDEFDRTPEEPFVGHFKGNDEEVDWAIVWLPEEVEQPIMESYVNLIPTVQDGTHVNGFRTGLTEALREFCEFRNLLPHDDV